MQLGFSLCQSPFFSCISPSPLPIVIISALCWESLHICVVKSSVLHSLPRFYTRRLLISLLTSPPLFRSHTKSRHILLAAH
jgi:hypothetical protein